MKIKLLFVSVVAIILFSGCSLKATDYYEICGESIISLTAVCGDNELVEVEGVLETDDVRRYIYSDTIRYTYTEISDSDKSEYFERLKKHGYHKYDDNTYQSTPKENGEFYEVRIENNSVFISVGIAQIDVNCTK